MNKIRNLNEKYWYSPDGQLVFRVSKLNPILMSSDSMNKMENTVIPEQATGVIQESVFFRPEPVIATQEVMPAVETPTPIPEEIVQPSVNTSAVPEHSNITIDVPGMEVDSTLSAAEDPTIAQAIDSELTISSKLVTPTEFETEVEASKEAAPEVQPVVKTNEPDFIDVIVQTEARRKEIQSKIDSALEAAKALVNTYTDLQKDVEAFCNYVSRETSKAKEAYDIRGRNNAAVLGAVSAGIASLNTNNMDQTIVR